MIMDAKARFTMFDGDLELVDDSVEKYNPNHDDRGRFAGGSTGGAALHQALQPKLDVLSAKIDALPKEPKIAPDIAQARVHISAASKAPTAQGSAQSLMNAHMALDRAAQRVVGSQTPLAFSIKDIRNDARLIEQGLRRP